MKKISLIHTVKSVLDSFDVKVKASTSEELVFYNTFDDFLSIDANEKKYFSKENRNRLFNLLKNAEYTNCDLIVVTCSTLSPYIPEIREYIKTPILTIDEKMVEEAVLNGRKILVLATAQSAIEPVKQNIIKVAKEYKKEIEVQSKMVEGAFERLKADDVLQHDLLIKETVKTIKDVDTIILAQASMAHLEDELKKITEYNIYSSPKLCVKAIKEILDLK